MTSRSNTPDAGDSITRLFPTPPAGSSMPGKPPAVADDEQATATRSVRPIPAFVLDSILDRSPSYRIRLAANDRAYHEAERRASGGKVGVAIVFAVAVVIGVLFATGGVL